jgi:hypothetical protein
MMMSGKQHSLDSRIDLAQVRPKRILDKTGKCRLYTEGERYDDVGEPTQPGQQDLPCSGQATENPR